MPAEFYTYYLFLITFYLLDKLSFTSKSETDPFSVSIDKKTLAQIEEACKELGITRVEFLRMAAAEKLEAYKNKKAK